MRKNVTCTLCVLALRPHHSAVALVALNTHLLVHLECMLASCEIFVGVVGSRLAARKLI